MQRFLKTLFGFVLLATGILGMLAIPVESPTGINARLWFIPAALSAIMIGAIRVWLFRRYGETYRFINGGRYGLLTHRWCPPLTKLERRLRTAEIAQLVMFIRARKIAKKPWTDMGLSPPPDEPQDIIYKQITALVTQWTSDHPVSHLSDDEYRSINKLHVYAGINYDRVDYRQQFLNDVKDVHIFQNLRTEIDVWYKKKNRKQDEHKLWLEKIGDPDASHLLKYGWIAFLKRLLGTDVNFWHMIVTEFHNLGGDRLEAAFWILEQPECD